MITRHVYFLLYVDGMLITSKSEIKIYSLKTKLDFEFEMKDLRNASKILGMDISRNIKSGTIHVSKRSLKEYENYFL